MTASLKLQISICHSGSSAASGLMGVLVNATSLQNKAVKMQRKLDGSLSRLTPSSPDHRWHQIRTHRDRSTLNRGICVKSSGDTHNITGSGSAPRGSAPPSAARTDRRSLRGLPICRVISATIPKHVPLITGCPPAATPPLTLHPPAQRYTSRQDRL